MSAGPVGGAAGERSAARRRARLAVSLAITVLGAVTMVGWVRAAASWPVADTPGVITRVFLLAMAAIQALPVLGAGATALATWTDPPPERNSVWFWIGSAVLLAVAVLGAVPLALDALQGMGGSP